MRCTQETAYSSQTRWRQLNANSICPALMALKALIQPTRMEIFRMIHTSVDGECVDVIASRFSCPLSNISLHLAVLARAGLIVGRRQEHDVVYRSNPGALEDLLSYVLGTTIDRQFSSSTDVSDEM